MSTDLKPTGSIEKNNADNIIENNSNLRALNIIPSLIFSSKDKDKKCYSKAINEIQTKNRLFVTTDFSIKDNEKKNLNPGKKSKINNNENIIKFIITSESSNENKEKENIKNYPIFINKIESSKLNIYNYIIFYYS